MAKNFNVLRSRMRREAQEKAKVKADQYAQEMALDELREAREMTQVHLANIMGVNQAAISKIEHRTDVYISTLRDFVKALGGQLRIEAVFPEGKIEINQFKKLTRSA